MALSDEDMHDSQTGVDHPDAVYENDTSQTTYGSGSPTTSSESSVNADTTLSDSSSPNAIMSTGVNNMQRASDLLFGVSIHAEPTKSKIIDLAYSAMDELSKIGVTGKPLWQPQKEDRHETLNDIEYLRQFGQVDETLREIIKLVEVGEPQSLPNFDSYRPEPSTSKATPSAALQIEASRDMEYIKMSPIDLVELLVDMNQWSRALFNIVSRTTMLGTLADGVEGSNDGKLHVMNAELHLPTPFVPARECYFARYCKRLSQEMWGVVDVSLEKFFPSPSSNFRRRPSGCLIMGMPNGFSKVIWVEHVEADHSQLHSRNNRFLPLVTTGFAFGATRWLASIVRYNEWSETLKTPTFVAEDGVLIPQVGRTSFLNLADRMIRSFCSDISASTANPWMQIPFPGSPDVRFYVKNNMEETGKPCGTTVVFSSSLWLNASPNRLYNFLRHESSRSKWDLLSRQLSIQEFAYMTDGKNPRNRVSLIRAYTSEGKLEIFYLQKSYIDSTGGYVIYAPLDEFAMAGLANGSNPDKVMILPSGFSILPAGLPGKDDDKDNGAGSLLTVSFHIIESPTTIRSFIPPVSIETIYKIIVDTVSAIRDAVLYKNLLNNWTEG